ncbi:DUF2779 domain-containing protein [Sulfurimonas sp. MAG313]|nr:DUF2779 domain-containing protein [Sulfurimonas sp. MAG313]MDF1881270.1 DUF2779 domain-containing protein [Sulfurimonas sp. MAG313]
MTLSKSKYIQALQCHKALWLNKHRPELKGEYDGNRLDVIKSGNTIGELAKDLFPGGEEIEFNRDDFKGMLSKTKDLVAEGKDVIYEATFSEKGIFAMADILVRNEDKWDIYEVKGSTSVKDVHVDDAAVQWYALSKVLELNNAYIVHVNNEYVRKGDLDVHALFTIENITEDVLAKQEEIPKQLKEMETVLDGKMPEIKIGKHCSNPYECDFSDFCWKDVPYPSVFNISYAMGKQWSLYEQGIVKIEDIPDDFYFGPNASLQIKHHHSQEIKIDKSEIKEFLDTIEYPINFFDFETFQNVVPRFDGQRPYAQMPFQYSLHILHEDGRLEHKEFLGDENCDPRRPLAQQMLKDLTPRGSIAAFSQGFEKGQIRRLAEFVDDISEELLDLTERFVDIAHPFQQKNYYHPGFNGRYSIKVVLPTLFPNDDELDYKKLGSVQNGGDAMDTFANLYLLKDVCKRDQIRKDLLAYCRLDTLAMVRIWEKLHTFL